MTIPNPTLERRGLARGLKVWIDVLLFLSLGAGVVFTVGWPIAAVAGHGRFDLSIPVSIGGTSFRPTHPLALAETASADILPGRLPLSQSPSLVETRGELRLLTSSFEPALVFWIISLVFFLALVLGLLLLRGILRTTADGHPFHPSNPGRLNRLGWIILVASLVIPVIQYLFGVWVLPEPPATEFPISPSLEFQEEWAFCGLLVLLLAAVWKEAVRMAEEQSLTV